MTEEEDKVTVDLGEEELQERKTSLEAAEENLLAAEEKLKSEINEYWTDDARYQDIVESAKSFDLMEKPPWFKFWKKSRSVPGKFNFKDFAGETKTYDRFLSNLSEEFHSLLIEDVKWKKTSFFSYQAGIFVESHPTKSESGKKLYRLEFQSDAPIDAFVLTLIHGPTCAEENKDLVCFKELYNFVGGRTSLVESVRTFGEHKRLAPRSFLDLVNWKISEDGTVTVLKKSVKFNKNKIAGAVRAGNLVEGFRFKKDEAGRTNITMLSQRTLEGWALSSYVNWVMPDILVNDMLALEKAASIVAEKPNYEELVKKFVNREVEDL